MVSFGIYTRFIILIFRYNNFFYLFCFIINDFKEKGSFFRHLSWDVIYIYIYDICFQCFTSNLKTINNSNKPNQSLHLLYYFPILLKCHSASHIFLNSDFLVTYCHNISTIQSQTRFRFHRNPNGNMVRSVNTHTVCL